MMLLQPVISLLIVSLSTNIVKYFSHISDVIAGGGARLPIEAISG